MLQDLVVVEKQPAEDQILPPLPPALSATPLWRCPRYLIERQRMAMPHVMFLTHQFRICAVCHNSASRIMVDWQ